MNRAKGFTLIELLTVIAIIAILAAITFPIIGRVKDTAYRSSDSSNMNSLRTALGLYALDQGGYPPALLGYASLYETGPDAGKIVPANQAISFMFPRRIDSMETLRPAMDRVDADPIYTTAVWPNQDSRATLTAPILDLNGDGVIDSSGVPDPSYAGSCAVGTYTAGCYYDDDPNARQAYGPTDEVTRTISWSDYCSAFLNQNRDQTLTNTGGEATVRSWQPCTPTPNPIPAPVAIPGYFYKVSGYDVGQVKEPDGSTRFELHYALFWTTWGVAGGNAHDDPRQLGYADPPDNTIVTWDSFFRDYDNNLPTRSKRDIVLTLGGGAKPVDSKDMSDLSWRALIP